MIAEPKVIAQVEHFSSGRVADKRRHLLAGIASKPRMRIVLAQPRGFCAGVERAIEIVERALETFGPPVYVRHEIVHNRHVVENLRAKGARFVENLDEVPTGSVTVFSAHGVAREVEDDARNRGLRVIDAICPLVSKIHVEGRHYAAQDKTVILIGHAGHAEVEGTTGQIPGGVMLVSTTEDVSTLKVPDPEKVAYITQTTLSVDDTKHVIDALKIRFPSIVGPDTKDICYATQNRQWAIHELARSVDVLLVIGSENSSNSNRLCEIGLELGVPSYLIDDASALDFAWLSGVSSIGITAGASTPDSLVQDLIDLLHEHADVELSTLPGIEENVRFRLPPQLSNVKDSALNQSMTPIHLPAAEESTIPLRHIAAILDGNRRWAIQNGLPILEGYRNGGAKVHEFLDWCSEAGIPLVSLWPLSIDNLYRKPEELCDLLSVITHTLDELAASGRWQLRLLGDLNVLPAHIAISMQSAEKRTQAVNGMVVNIAIAYGGRHEIVHAVRKLLAEHTASGTLEQLSNTLCSEDIAGRLYTAGQPDPDLVIRTSGEQRLSGFMPWQSAYAEYYFSPVCWPAFKRKDFKAALEAYATRRRRFGQ